MFNTTEVHNQIKNFSDTQKELMSIQWTTHYAVETITCMILGKQIDNVDWKYIFDTNDLGHYSDGDRVIIKNKKPVMFAVIKTAFLYNIESTSIVFVTINKETATDYIASMKTSVFSAYSPTYEVEEIEVR